MVNVDLLLKPVFVMEKWCYILAYLSYEYLWQSNNLHQSSNPNMVSWPLFIQLCLAHCLKFPSSHPVLHSYIFVSAYHYHSTFQAFTLSSSNATFSGGGRLQYYHEWHSFRIGDKPFKFSEIHLISSLYISVYLYIFTIIPFFLLHFLNIPLLWFVNDNMKRDYDS